MNLWFRLLAYFFTYWAKPHVGTARVWSDLGFRVWPADVDFNFHMTNGRYLSIADFGRIDLIARSGLLRVAMRRRWVPIVNTSTVSFRKEMDLWRKFRLETRLCYWDEKTSIFEHCFRLDGGEHKSTVAAICFTSAAFYDRRAQAFVPVETMLAEIGVSETSPDPTPEVIAFLASQKALRDSELWETIGSRS